MMHHALGIGLLVYLIAFAFGERTARAIVAGTLVLGAAAFLYVFVRVATGSI